jgi:two-component system, NtrC family, sensor kinase
LSQLLGHYQALGRAASSHPSLANLAAEVETSSRQADLEYLLAEIPAALDQSSEGIDHVARIVRAMREFSHPGTEERTATDANQAIGSTLVVSRHEWKYVAEVETRLAPDLPLVPCLAGEINQVFLNLIVNAAQAIGEKVKAGGSSAPKGRIVISTRQDGAWVEIAIQDTGPGIPPEVLPRIFDPFFTTKPVGAGTGQGLAIAHAVVVETHGGSISVESDDGRGATFFVRLPVQPGGAPVVASPAGNPRELAVPSS